VEIIGTGNIGLTALERLLVFAVLTLILILNRFQCIFVG